MRGLGGWACVPSEHSCIYEPDKEICMACQVFGTTGWRRRFRIEVEPAGDSAWQENIINVRPPGRSRGWFLGPGYTGALRIILTGDAQVLGKMLAVFRFLEEWGSIGAKPQLGYGCFKITAITWDGVKQEDSQFELHPYRDAREPEALPDLRTFTFFKLRFSPPTRSDWWTQIPGIRELRSQRDRWSTVERLAIQGMVPTAPVLKNTLRFGREWSSPTVPRWLFGTLRKDARVRSKISTSWAYRDGNDWEIRGWVYIPADATGRYAR